MGSLAQVGLALATSIGAWINFLLVLYWSARAGLIAADATLRSSLIKLGAAGGGLALVLVAAAPAIGSLTSSLPRFRSVAELLVLAALGGTFYIGVAAALFGRSWLARLRKRTDRTATRPLGT
jgi:putative peptidoglycan lipid II flippase